MWHRVRTPHGDLPAGTEVCPPGWRRRSREDRYQGTLECWKWNHTQASHMCLRKHRVYGLQIAKTGNNLSVREWIDKLISPDGRTIK